MYIVFTSNVSSSILVLCNDNQYAEKHSSHPVTLLKHIFCKIIVWIILAFFWTPWYDLCMNYLGFLLNALVWSLFLEDLCYVVCMMLNYWIVILS